MCFKFEETSIRKQNRCSQTSMSSKPGVFPHVFCLLPLCPTRHVNTKDTVTTGLRNTSVFFFHIPVWGFSKEITLTWKSEERSHDNRMKACAGGTKTNHNLSLKKHIALDVLNQTFSCAFEALGVRKTAFPWFHQCLHSSIHWGKHGKPFSAPGVQASTSRLGLRLPPMMQTFCLN